MSRPSWLYGTPMDRRTVQACLDNEDLDHHPTDNNSHIHNKHTYDMDQQSVYMEWHRFSSSKNFNASYTHTTTTTTKIKKPRHRLLLAQYSGYGKYAQMLDLVAPVNAAYAQHWGHDFVLLQGTALHIPGIRTSCPQEPRSTFNKIPLLQLAYQHRETYDRVLILDTDAMIVNFDVDISNLLPSTHLLCAHRVWRFDWTNTWDINAGITLWNTHHPNLPQVLQHWEQSVMEHPFLVVERNDDQYFLQTLLLHLIQEQHQPLQQQLGRLFQTGWWGQQQQQQQQPVGGVYSLTREFNYYEGTVVKHFKRDARSWSRTSLEQRLLRIQETIQQMNCGSIGFGSIDADGKSGSESCQYPLTTRFSKRRPITTDHGVLVPGE